MLGALCDGTKLSDGDTEGKDTEDGWLGCDLLDFEREDSELLMLLTEDLVFDGAEVDDLDTSPDDAAVLQQADRRRANTATRCFVASSSFSSALTRLVNFSNDCGSEKPLLCCVTPLTLLPAWAP